MEPCSTFFDLFWDSIWFNTSWSKRPVAHRKAISDVEQMDANGTWLGRTETGAVVLGGRGSKPASTLVAMASAEE